MWILFRITIRMMHPVHNPISPWNQEGRTLSQPGGQIKSALPIFTSGVHFMGTETM